MHIEHQLTGFLKLHSEKFSTTLMLILGPILIIALFGLVGVVTYSYFIDVLPIITPYYGNFHCLPYTAIGLFILFNILFNYIMCVIVGPGHPPDIPGLPKCKYCNKAKPPRAHHC